MNAESEISRVLFSSKSRDHLSRIAVTSNLEHPTRSPDGPPDYDPIWTCSRWGLPCQVCHQPRGELLPPRFTLACAEAIGGLFSVALSVGSRRPDVIWHPALWSPDFPPPCSAINLEGSAADFRTAVARPTPVGNLNRPEGMCKLRLRGSAVFFRLLQYTFVKAVLFSTGQLRCNVTRLAWW